MVIYINTPCRITYRDEDLEEIITIIITDVSPSTIYV
jgi:hypothetical protein